jgi:Zn-dependent protease
VAIAGPVANLLMALFWVLVIRLGLVLGSGSEVIALYILYTGVAGVIINSILMLFNLLPLPPLDGGRVLTALLPGPLSWQVSRIEPYGLPILIILLFTGVLGSIVGPLIMYTMAGFIWLSGLSGRGFQYIFSTLMGS